MTPYQLAVIGPSFSHPSCPWRMALGKFPNLSVNFLIYRMRAIIASL